MIKRTLFFGSPAYLSTSKDQLIVRKVDKQEEPQSIPIEDVGVIVLEHPQITITHKLLSHLIANKVVVISCDDRRLPISYTLPIEGHTEQSKRIKAQIEMSRPLQGSLWRQTVQRKIVNQALVLKKYKKDNRKLLYWAKQVMPHDGDNHESFSSAYYWQALLGESFVRDRYGPPPNNLLNYGYAILRAVTARALVSSGLHPSLGIFHKNKYNAYCLADDIMEPYRPLVDDMVIEIMHSGTNFEEITMEIKQILLQIPAMDVKIGKRSGPLMTAMSRTTSSLYDCMTGKKRKLLYPVYDGKMDD